MGCHRPVDSTITRTLGGLNSVLRGDNTPEDQRDKKLRDDHRHHAIDAVVIAMISRSLIQHVSTEAEHSENRYLEKLFIDHKGIDPWDNFRSDVIEQMEKLIVSHRPRYKNQGALHKATAYGIDEE